MLESMNNEIIAKFQKQSTVSRLSNSPHGRKGSSRLSDNKSIVK